MTPSGWRRITYSDVMVETDDRAGEKTYLPVLSVTKNRGIMLASERFGRAMHGRDLGKYRIAFRGSIIADPMLLWDGSIGLQTVSDAGLVSPDYRVYQPTADVSSEFLATLARSPQMILRYQDGARGTNIRRNRITRSDFLAIPIELPPISEQVKIAAILSSMDDAIQTTQAVIDQLGVVKKALMADLLTRGVPGRHTKFKQTEIGEVPEEWAIYSVEQLLSDGTLVGIQDGNHGAQHPKAADFVHTGIPFVMARDLVGRTINFETCVYLRLAQAETLRIGFARPGDVLLTHKGTIGRVAIVPNRFQSVILTPQVTYYRIGDSTKLSSEYLATFFESEPIRNQLAILSKQSTRDYIGITAQKKLLVALPPISEQLMIEQMSSCIEENIQGHARTLTALGSVKSALQTVLLTGELRVPLDKDPP